MKNKEKRPKFYMCGDCGKNVDSGMMKLVSRKIELYPCGLPRIDGNMLYTIEEMDYVQKMCARLGRHEICTKEMAGDCCTQTTKLFNSQTPK